MYSKALSACLVICSLCLLFAASIGESEKLDCQNGCSSHVPKQDPETLNPLQLELILGTPKEYHVEKPSNAVEGLGFRALDGAVPVPVDPKL